MSIREQVTHELDNLSNVELEQVAEYVAFLKFRARVGRMPALEEAQLAALYSEFSDEDRELAEEGLSDYTEGLAKTESRGPFASYRQHLYDTRVQSPMIHDREHSTPIRSGESLARIPKERTDGRLCSE